jgi:flagellar FliL protein
MAANRIDPGSRPPESEAPKTEAPTAPAPAPAAGGFRAWLPLLATFALMPLLAFAMTRFVLVPQLQKGLGITVTATEPHAKTTKEEPDAKHEAVPMNKLLVNVAGTMGGRYLLVSLSVVGADQDFKAKMAAHDPQLRDLACSTLAAKTLADLEKPGVRNIIRSELISGFNNILGGAVVQEIYLTEFAIQ